MKTLFDKYTLRARIFPAVLGVIPFALTLKFIPIEPILLKIVTAGIFSTALVYVSTQFIIRIPAKMFEDWLFSNGLYMPTTNLLMYKDFEYQDQFKDNIRSQIQRDFGITLSSKEEEIADEVSARRKIKDATKLMINKVKGGYLLLKHNYEYGFSRNLWSSSIFGLVGSLILLYISIANNNESMMTISISFGLVYLLYISFGFLLIKYVGKLYARKLIEEYYEN
jgi:hypothetical protein